MKDTMFTIGNQFCVHRKPRRNLVSALPPYCCIQHRNSVGVPGKLWSDDSLTTTGASGGERPRRGYRAFQLRNAEIEWRRTVANEHASLSHGRGRWFEPSIAHQEIPANSVKRQALDFRVGVVYCNRTATRLATTRDAGCHRSTSAGVFMPRPANEEQTWPATPGFPRPRSPASTAPY